MAVLVIRDLRAGVAAAYEHPSSAWSSDAKLCYSRSGGRGSEPVSTGDRRVTAAEGVLLKPAGPASRTVPQFTDRAADREHRSYLCPEPGRSAHARRSARRCRPAIPQRRP